MAHAHKHFGAERVVKGEMPHTSADMNVTPLIDVLLVLLIIFMAALPLTQKGVDVNLPLETKQSNQPVDTNQIVLDIGATPGPGQLLGNLLCSVAHLLDNGGPLQGILAQLNNILRLL